MMVVVIYKELQLPILSPLLHYSGGHSILSSHLGESSSSQQFRNDYRFLQKQFHCPESSVGDFTFQIASFVSIFRPSKGIPAVLQLMNKEHCKRLLPTNQPTSFTINEKSSLKLVTCCFLNSLLHFFSLNNLIHSMCHSPLTWLSIE